MKVIMIPTEKLILRMSRDITIIDEEYLQLMIMSIKNNGFAGFLIVDEFYTILDGTYRFLAAKRLNMKEIPYTKELDEHIISIINNFTNYQCYFRLYYNI